MLDKSGRISIRKEILSKDYYIKITGEAKIFYDPIERAILLRDKYTSDLVEGAYFVANHKIDEKGRIIIPISIRNAFPGATYLPVARGSRIYILIIEHNEKPE